MLNTFFSALTNLIMLVPFHVARFREASPGVDVLLAGGAKAITSSQPDVVRGPDWIAAYRGALIVTPQALFCGKWRIDVDTIQEARLLKLRGGYVLVITVSPSLHYQFGLVPDRAWERKLPFPVKIEGGTVSLSTFSKLLRVGVVVMLMVTIWQLVSQK